MSEIAYPDSNRVGMLLISFETLKSDRAMVGALLALCTVLNVERHESGRGQAYIAASELFQPLTEGEEIPEYRVEFVHGQPFANPEWEAKRVDSGAFGFAAFRKIIVRVPAVHLSVAANATRH